MEAIDAGENLFLTGRAGTGKSTLLELIVEKQKNAGRMVAVAAPTGVAALNVSGLTIHKLFGFGAESSLGLSRYRPPALLAHLELLVIDEVSMARADLMDMMDLALRRSRKSKSAFGGLQVLLVGDLFQLPPVVTANEADAVMTNYASPFFFSSKAIEDLKFETLDLPDVFRQSDQKFISLLNAIRDGSAGEAEIETINDLVVEDVSSSKFDDYITLATTNKIAERINAAKLAQLGGEIHCSYADFGGEFDEKTYKVEIELSFAVGAQVMMLVNRDNFANGSIARIEEVKYNAAGQPSVRVRFAESNQSAWVGHHRWSILQPRNISGRVENEEIGYFEQLPFKLAWAVTVHKSQGKTFEKVIFDKGRSVFAEGQLYVALSRCRTMEGLALSRPIRRSDLRTSPEVIRFHRSRTMPARAVQKVPITYVGFVETGGGEYSKLAEISLVRLENGRELRFSSLVNPLRDLADARETGLTAKDLTLAPSSSELGSLVSWFLHGSVLVGEKVGRFLHLMGRSPVGETTLGIDIVEHTGIRRELVGMTASERAQLARESFAEISRQKFVFSEFDSCGEPLRLGSYFLSRYLESVTSSEVLVDYLGWESAQAETWLAADVANTFQKSDEFGVSSSKTSAVRDALWAAAQRDGNVTDDELELVRGYCAFWGTAVPTRDAHLENSILKLSPGTKICLTGEPSKASGDSELRKSYLRELINEHGLEEVSSVTISRCDLVVAFSSSSMSGKAKRARELGKPLMSAQEFVTLVTKGPESV